MTMNLKTTYVVESPDSQLGRPHYRTALLVFSQSWNRDDRYSPRAVDPSRIVNPTVGGASHSPSRRSMHRRSVRLGRISRARNESGPRLAHTISAENLVRERAARQVEPSPAPILVRPALKAHPGRVVSFVEIGGPSRIVRRR